MNSSAKLPRSKMLKKPADISRGLKYGRRYRGKISSIYLITPGLVKQHPGQVNLTNKSGETIPDFAVLVRKKCGKAHRRNRLKRLSREFFRLNQKLFIGYEAVIISLENRIEDDSDLIIDLKIISDKISGSN